MGLTNGALRDVPGGTPGTRPGGGLVPSGTPPRHRRGRPPGQLLLSHSCTMHVSRRVQGVQREEGEASRTNRDRKLESNAMILPRNALGRGSGWYNQFSWRHTIFHYDDE